MSKRTKIIATIGPASSSPSVIAKLIKAGMDAARLNFSHGDRKDHRNRIRLIRQEAKKAGRHIAIIQDLQGPKLRVGDMQNDGVTLKRGETVTLTTKKVLGTGKLVFVSYPRLARDLRSGDRVLFDDGLFEAVVEDMDGMTATLRMLRSSAPKPRLKPQKGINFPDTELTVRSLTEFDKSVIPFALKYADLVGFSFIRQPEEV